MSKAHALSELPWMLAIHLLPEHFVDAEPLDTATVMAGHIANKWYLYKNRSKSRSIK